MHKQRIVAVTNLGAKRSKDGIFFELVVQNTENCWYLVNEDGLFPDEKGRHRLMHTQGDVVRRWQPAESKKAPALVKVPGPVFTARN